MHRASVAAGAGTVALDDGQLVTQSLAGDAEAFGQLVDRYGGLVRGTIMDIVRRPDELDDLAQDAFCRAYVRLATLREPAKFAHWLARIASNAAIEWLRHERTTQTAAGVLSLDVAPIRDQPDDMLYEEERSDLLWEALDRLGLEDRRALVLYYLEGCDLRDMARYAGVAPRTVKWRLYRGRRKLRQELEQVLLQRRKQAAPERRQLRSRVLAALPAAAALPVESEAAALTGAAAGGAWSWATAPNLVAASITASVVVHLSGAALFDWWPKPGWGISTVGSSPGRAVIEAEAFDGSRPLTEVDLVPPLQGASEGQPEMVEALTAVPDQTSPLEPALELQEAEMLSLVGTGGGVGASAAHARGAAGTDPARDTGQSRRLRHDGVDPQVGGYVLQPLWLRGTGSYSGAGVALEDLARYARDRVGLEVRMGEPANGFQSGQPGRTPICFLFQGGGRLEAAGVQLVTLDDDELAAMGEYLLQGGFLFVEGDKRYLEEMARHVGEALGRDGRLIAIPTSHALYHCYNDYDSGFPGENKPQPGADAYDERNPSEYSGKGLDLAVGLWGYEVHGRLVAVLSDIDLLRNWRADLSPQELDSTAVEAGVRWKIPRLRAAANVLVYAVQRSLWMR